MSNYETKEFPVLRHGTRSLIPSGWLLCNVTNEQLMNTKVMNTKVMNKMYETLVKQPHKRHMT